MTDPQEEPVTDLAVRPHHAETLIDTELLEEAQRQLSAPSTAAAINEALRRLVVQERVKRREALENLHRLYEEGALDFGAVDE